MKLKLLAGAIALAASGLANATYVTVHSQLFDIFGAALTGTVDIGSGSIATNNYVGSNTLVDTANKTPYYALFWIDNPVVPMGYTLSSINWTFADSLYAGGYITFTQSGNLTTQTASTSATVNTFDMGTGAVGAQLFSNTLHAYNEKTSGLGNPPIAMNVGDSWYLTSDGTAGGTDKTTAYTSSSFNLGTTGLATLATLNSSNVSDNTGNIDAHIRNYANIVAAADVILLPPPSVPEPTSMLLASLGLLGVAASRRNRKA